MKPVALNLMLLGAISAGQVCGQEEDRRAAATSRDALVESGSESDHLTGNWGGLRDRLVERGVHFGAGYVGEMMAVPKGGVRRGVAYEGLVEAAVELDFRKLGAGWDGGTFRLSGLWLHGESPSGKFIGDLQTVSNIDGYDSIRLYEVWYQQNWWDDRVSLRAGQQLADKEFATTEYGGLLANSSFGWPAFISANTVNTGPAFYVATTGLRLRVDLTKSAYVQAGVYDGDSFDDAAGDPRRSAHGTSWNVSGDQGCFVILEAGYRRNPESDAAGLPGNFKAGLWHHTGTFTDLYRDGAGGSFIVSGLPPKEHNGNVGAYGVAEQMVWREADGGPSEGVGVFLRGGFSPGTCSAVELAIDAGFQYTGPLPGRSEDVFALGIAYAQLSGDLRRQQRDDRDINGAAVPALASREIAVEAAYKVVLRPWWSLQPSCQFIVNPGGSTATENAVVVGLRTAITF